MLLASGSDATFINHLYKADGSMKNGLFVRFNTKILVAVFLLSVVFVSLSALSPVAEADIRTTRVQIDKLKDEKKDFERQRNEIQSRINAIEFERLTAMAKKTVLDDRIALTGLEIDNINAIIDHYITIIAEKEYEVHIAQTIEDAQFNKYRERVRDMEENGIITYLELIFDSTSFADMLARLDFISDIMNADEKAYNELVEARNETIAAKEALEQTKAELDEEKADLEQKEAELLEQLEEANEFIREIEKNLETERVLRAQVAEEEERIQREIAAKIEELRKLEEQARLARGTGELMWPANGNLTSGFGFRTHPVFGGRRFHNGIDIGAKHGSSVFAADSGVVLISEYSSGYGNYIVLSHGNGVTTLYAHLSSRSVSAGATVSKGQVIGLIGSTGVSTGPHLHFEVSVNGSRINPMTKL